MIVGTVVSAAPMSAETYNYRHFEMDDAEMAAFDAFPSHLRVGEPAPDLPLVDLATGAEVRLATLWKREHVVMEFGSFT